MGPDPCSRGSRKRKSPLLILLTPEPPPGDSLPVTVGLALRVLLPHLTLSSLPQKPGRQWDCVLKPCVYPGSDSLTFPWREGRAILGQGVSRFLTV